MLLLLRIAEVYIGEVFAKNLFSFKSKVLIDNMHWHIYHVSQLKVHTYKFAARFVLANHCHGMQSNTVLLESIAFPANRGSFPAVYNDWTGLMDWTGD